MALNLEVLPPPRCQRPWPRDRTLNNGPLFGPGPQSHFSATACSVPVIARAIHGTNFSTAKIRTRELSIVEDPSTAGSSTAKTRTGDSSTTTDSSAVVSSESKKSWTPAQGGRKATRQHIVIADNVGAALCDCSKGS